jgi:hypothetical protein
MKNGLRSDPEAFFVASLPARERIEGWSGCRPGARSMAIHIKPLRFEKGEKRRRQRIPTAVYA